MKKYPNVFLAYSIVGFLFILDRILKQLAYTYQDRRYLIIHDTVGWEYFANPGVAFSLPIPTIVLWVLTPILLYWLYTHVDLKKGYNKTATILILLGAISNYIDRIALGITIDYIRIMTGIFNIADLMIILGIIILIKQKT